MESPAAVATQTGSAHPAPQTIVASKAMQCLSPTGAELPEDVMQRARSIENEQRQLIAQRESSQQSENQPTPHCEPHKPASQASSPSNGRGSSAPSTSTQAWEQKSTSSADPNLCVVSDNLPSARKRSTTGPRSFGGRRSRRPRALDINALHRERQFSGPYSANPLLHRKREPLEDGASAVETHLRYKRGPARVLDCKPLEPNPLDTDPRESNKGSIKLPLISEMTRAPFVASGGGRAPDKLWPPLCTPSPRSGGPLSLPTSASHNSLLTPPSATIPKSQLAAASLNLRDVSEHETVRAPWPAPSLTPSRLSPSQQKERYLQLCSEMWDLIKS